MVTQLKAGFAPTVMLIWQEEKCSQTIDSLALLRLRRYTKGLTLAHLRSMRKRKLWWRCKNWCLFLTWTTRYFTQKNSIWSRKWRDSQSTREYMVISWLIQIGASIIYGNQGSSLTSSSFGLSVLSSSSSPWTTMKSTSTRPLLAHTGYWFFPYWSVKYRCISQGWRWWLPPVKMNHFESRLTWHSTRTGSSHEMTKLALLEAVEPTQQFKKVKRFGKLRRTFRAKVTYRLPKLKLNESFSNSIIRERHLTLLPVEMIQYSLFLTTEKMFG